MRGDSEGGFGGGGRWQEEEGGGREREGGMERGRERGEEMLYKMYVRSDEFTKDMMSLKDAFSPVYRSPLAFFYQSSRR